MFLFASHHAFKVFLAAFAPSVALAGALEAVVHTPHYLKTWYMCRYGTYNKISLIMSGDMLGKGLRK